MLMPRRSARETSPQPSSNPWPAAFVAALFAWHPMHVESVAWIAERKDVLSTFFGLLALLAYAKYVTSDRGRTAGTAGSASPATRHPSLFYWLAVTCFALGLMSKPMLVTLPFVMLLLDFWPLGRFEGRRPEVGGQTSGAAGRNWRLIWEKWPFFLLTAVFCCITFWSQHGSGAVTGDKDFPLYLRIENSLISYGRYLWKMIWPVNLAVIYPLSGFLGGIWAEAMGMAVGLGMVSWIAWKKRTRFPYLFTGWFWYLGMLVPVIGIVQVGGAAMADRYSYLPFVGIFIIIAYGSQEAIATYRIGMTGPVLAAVAVLGACVGLTERQLSYWQNSVTLFEHAIAVTRDNDIAHSNLGLALDNEGHRNEALAEFREALRISPDSAEIRNNVADLYYEMGRTNEALEEYDRVLKLNPRAAFAWINIGNVDAALGRLGEAMTHYQQAARLEPQDPQIPFLIGKALLAEGRDREALPQFQDALRLDPDNFQTLTYLARVLASDENPQIRSGQVALAMAAKANEITGGIQPAMLDTVAMAYAEIGQFDEAQIAEEDALKLATAPEVKGDLPGMKARLKLYEERRPFRQSFAATTVEK
jgi:protein O-mannosyl-transferase